MDAHDVVRLCHQVDSFGAKQGWHFKAMPVIVWEFASFSDFAEARRALVEAIHASFPSKLLTHVEQTIDPHSVRIDAVRCTFILTCNMWFATAQGPKGAAQMQEGQDYMTNHPGWPGIK